MIFEACDITLIVSVIYFSLVHFNRHRRIFVTV